MIEEMYKKYGGALNALMNYMHLGIISRTFMLERHKAELDIILNSIDDKESSKINQITEMLIYRELFERLCLAIEDFSIIIYALKLELSDFHKNVLSQPNVQKNLSTINKVDIYNVLKYDDLSCITDPEEKNLIERIRTENVDGILQFINDLSSFLEHNWVIYTKLKHGNTINYNYQKINFDGVPTYILPVIYNTKEPQVTKSLMLNEPIYNKMQMILNSVLVLSHYICYTNYKYICACEQKHLIRDVFIKLEDDIIKEVESIVKKYNKNYKTYDINLQTEVGIDLNRLREIREMYDKINYCYSYNAYNKNENTMQKS